MTSGVGGGFTTADAWANEIQALLVLHARNRLEKDHSIDVDHTSRFLEITGVLLA